MTLRCPIPACDTDNEPEVESCARCGVPLRNLARLSGYPAQLFDHGLAAAKAGNLGAAKEFFAAVVHWCPLDHEARNALALANFKLGDTTQARHHWNLVLAKRSADPLATKGMAELDALG